MPYYEMITEPGTNSVMFAETDEEALGAAQAQHLKALHGEPGGPTGHPAERVVKLLKYDKHPVEYGLVSAEQVQAEVEAGIKALAEGGLINTEQLAAYVRQVGSPLANKETGHDSQFKMQESNDIWVAPEGGAS